MVHIDLWCVSWHFICAYCYLFLLLTILVFVCIEWLYIGASWPYD